MSAASEQFSCGICFNGYDKNAQVPLILPCGHTHCFSCLNRLPLPKQCPSCRVAIRDSISNLPRNYALLNAMEASHSDLVHLLDKLNLNEGLHLLVGPDEVQILSLISSEGVSGNVHKARFRGKEVAVKSYALQSQGSAVLDSAKREITVLLRTTLDCRHIVKCMGITLKDHEFWVIMKLYDRSLKQRINQSAGGRLPLQAALRYAEDIAQAMIELHDLGVVINDIKPDNVLLDDATDEAVLTDFGISRIVWSTFGAYRSASVQGTFPYMAPEQFEPSAGPGVTNKADIWGFGATLLHSLTGEMPWSNLSMMQIMRCVGDKKEAPAVADWLPAGVRQLLAQCFRADPHQRPSAVEVHREVVALMNAPLRGTPDPAQESFGGSLGRMQQYVGEVVGQLKGVIGEYSQQLQAVRQDSSRQASLLDSISTQVRALQKAVDCPSALPSPTSRPHLQSICSSRMSDAVINLRLNLPQTGDATLDSKLVRQAEGQATSTSLHHDGGQLAEGFGWPLAAACMLSKVLDMVEVTGAPLGDDGCRALAEALLVNPPLRHLKLEGCRVGPVGANLLARSLTRNTMLQVLVLNNNDIGPSGLSSFSSMLTANQHLTSLSLNRNSLRDPSPLAALLSSPDCRLRDLSLATNSLAHWDALGHALGCNASLTSLQLHYCTLDNVDAVMPITEGLALNSTLRTLNLSFNRFNWQGAAHIARALEANHTLSDLQLAGVGLGDQGLLVLASSLAVNEGLRRLKLDGNNISEKGAKVLAEALPSNQRLVHLSLFDNQIGDKGAHSMVVAAARCSSLKHLVLRNNKVGREMARWVKANVPQWVKLEVGA